MKFDWTKQLKDIHGRPAVMDGLPFTLGMAAMIALESNTEEGGKNPPPSVKAGRYPLMMRISTNDDLNQSEVDAIKTQITAALLSPWFIGQCVTLLKEEVKS